MWKIRVRERERMKILRSVSVPGVPCWLLTAFLLILFGSNRVREEDGERFFLAL